MEQKPLEKKNRPGRLPSGKVIMRASTIISLIFHAGMLLAVQKAFPINWFTLPLRTYKVELLRMPVDSLEDDEKSGADLARSRTRQKPDPVETEETISLDTKDKRYSSYAGMIKQRLMRRWGYPVKARENLIEGCVRILFSLDREGQLKNIKILQSSSYNILDSETTRTVRVAAPFPPFPGSVTVAKLNIKADFVYLLTAHR